jgi:hypothetical protein
MGRADDKAVCAPGEAPMLGELEKSVGTGLSVVGSSISGMGRRCSREARPGLTDTVTEGMSDNIDVRRQTSQSESLTHSLRHFRVDRTVLPRHL